MAQGLEQQPKLLNLCWSHISRTSMLLPFK